MTQQQPTASDLSRYDSLQVIFEPFPGGEMPEGFEVTSRTLQAEFIDNVRASGKFSVVETAAAGGKVLEARLRIDALNYVHGAARGMLGLMAGRAVLGATLTLRDPQTGAVVDTFRGSDASNHRHGALGATTGRQITAMAKVFSARLVERKTSAPAAPVAQATEPPAAAPTSPVEPSDAGVEIMFWESIRDSRDPSDARAMAKALRETGFNVILVEDASQASMQRAIRSFGERIAKGGVGLFYYAGHGLQVKGRNYLVPVNADIAHEDEIEFTAVDVNQVLAKMDTAKNGLNIVILDACRNNPFQRSFRSMQTGLAQMDAPTGTFIAFATAPGSVAADGSGDNGVYTKYLLAEIAKPGVQIEQLFKQVRNGVMSETKGQQIPWESSSLRGEFAFRRGLAQPNVADAVAEALKREREVQRVEMEKILQAALERQRRQLEAAGFRPQEPAKPAPIPAKPAALIASIAPAPLAGSSSTRLPQPGDTWKYRLSETPAGAMKRERDYVVKVTAASEAGILDQASADGAAPAEWAHTGGHYLAAQFVSVFSPYLAAFEDLQAGAAVQGIAEHDEICATWYDCRSTGKVIGRETVQVPQGSFEAIKVVVEQEWRVRMGSRQPDDGVRKLTLWYAPKAKRVVKVTSRADGASRSAYHTTNFDLELLSYELR